MAFCTNCGKELASDAKFCSVCGGENPVTANGNAAERKQEYVGKIKKCPACGEEILALTAICPACGHEFNSVKVSAVLQEFIDNVNECDRRIANAPNPPKTGWASWSKTKRIWWVILNIFTSGIPLVIYLIWPLLKYSSTPKLTADEKQKASLIENFPFPNDRESILEALLFARSKVAFLATEKVDRKTAYWTRLWSTKAEQLYEKAEIMFNGDPVANNAMSEITAQKEHVSKTVKFRAMAGAAILVVAIVFAGIRGGAFEIDTTDYNATFDWQTNDLFSYLPEPQTNYGRIERESEKQIIIDLYQISQEDFDSYVKACRNSGFSYEVTKTDSVFYAENADGYDLDISYDNSTKVMHISLDSYGVGAKTDTTANTTESPTTEPSPTVEPTTPPTDSTTTPTTAPPEAVGFAEGTYRTFVIENYTFSIPNYWEEDGSQTETKQFCIEVGESSAMLTIRYPEESDDEYEVSFEGLFSDNNNMIDAIEGSYFDCSVDDYEVFESATGIKGILYHFTYTEITGLFSSQERTGLYFCFPSPEDRRWFYVILTETNIDENDTYKKDFITMLESLCEN